MIRVVMLLAATSLLLGCSSINLNVGESDYRIADDAGLLRQKYYADQATRQIVAKDSVSISLLQAYIHDFSERGERSNLPFFGAPVRGEIAIVARVFELKNGETLDFRPSATKKLGRLVYYSEDVRSGGHLLNESALPLYGPITYEGGPLLIELTVLELDVGEASQVKGLLSTLANLGAKAYAPASPILSALDKLGEQLLAGGQDDIEMQYTFALYPNDGSDAVTYPRLQTGNYVIMRKEPRLRNPATGSRQGFDPTPWERLKLNKNLGRVFECKDEELTGTPPAEKQRCKVAAPTDESKVQSALLDTQLDEYRQQTYLVLQVNTGFSPVGLDVAQEFIEFQTELEAAQDSSKATASLGEVIDKFKVAAAKTETEDLTRKAAQRVLALLNAYCGATGLDSDRLAIEIYEALVQRADLPPQEPARTISTADDQAGNQNGAKEKPAFTDAQWRKFITTIRAFAASPAGVTREAIEKTANVSELKPLLACRPKTNTQ